MLGFFIGTRFLYPSWPHFQTINPHVYGNPTIRSLTKEVETPLSHPPAVACPTQQRKTHQIYRPGTICPLLPYQVLHYVNLSEKRAILSRIYNCPNLPLANQYHAHQGLNHYRCQVLGLHQLLLLVRHASADRARAPVLLAIRYLDKKGYNIAVGE